QAPPPARNERTITHLPRPDQPRKIRVDEPMDCMASNAATKNGLVLSSLPAASGILVQSPRATTEWEFDLASNPDRRTGSKHGLLRGACHRARIRAARWLAMTIQTQRIPTDALSSTRPQRPENFADLPGHHDVRRTDRRGDVDADRGEGARGRRQLHR